MAGLRSDSVPRSLEGMLTVDRVHVIRRKVLVDRKTGASHNVAAGRLRADRIAEGSPPERWTVRP